MPAHFGPDLFKFLKDLKKNNNREWFKANKARYEEVLKGPALDFISDFERPLHKVSEHFRADPRPVGGSLFRIYRDTRFSKDKTPYKTQVGIHFRHRSAKDAYAPGFYLHLSPKDSFCGLGIWHPDCETANKIRQHITKEPDAWKKATRRKAFTNKFELTGDSLKRPPRGFDKEHPLVSDLMRKDFIAVAKIKDTDVTKPAFQKQFASLVKTGAPMVEFICEGLNVKF